MIKLITLILFSNCVFSETLKGTARNSNGEIVYTESHNIQRNKDGQVEYLDTDYFNSAGKKIANLTANFKDSPYVPNTKFEDFRFGRVFMGTLKAGEKNNTYFITETKNGLQVKSTELKIEDNLISGSGFDNFIFKELVTKNIDTRAIQFLVLPRHDYYQFEVSKIKDESSVQDHYKIKPSSMLLKIFVKEINIYYQNNSRRLTKYTGLSNLPSDSDDSQEVIIDYDKE